MNDEQQTSDNLTDAVASSLPPAPAVTTSPVIMESESDNAPKPQEAQVPVKRKRSYWWFLLYISPLAVSYGLFLLTVAWTDSSCNALAEADRGECAANWLWLLFGPLFIVAVSVGYVLVAVGILHFTIRILRDMRDKRNNKVLRDE